MKANIVLDYINEYELGNAEAITKIKQYALEELTIKNSKNADTTKARMDYAKKRANDKNEPRKSLKGAFINDGKQLLCDGYIVARFEPIDNIATVPEDVPALKTLGTIIDDASRNYGDTVVISKSTLITTLGSTLSALKAYKAKAKYDGIICPVHPNALKNYPLNIQQIKGE